MVAREFFELLLDDRAGLNALLIDPDLLLDLILLTRFLCDDLVVVVKLGPQL